MNFGKRKKEDNKNSTEDKKLFLDFELKKIKYFENGYNYYKSLYLQAKDENQILKARIDYLSYIIDEFTRPLSEEELEGFNEEEEDEFLTKD